MQMNPRPVVTRKVTPAIKVIVSAKGTTTIIMVTCTYLTATDQA